ncbi:MAG: hypothetical protein QOE15_3380 [Acidimicrobiaceae bacterium]|nr:hypothetical protein [Acidimicrobiaceae bacterium]
MVDKGGRWDGRTTTELAARSLVMEMAAGEAFGCLIGAGVPAILLKGPAVASWLYRPEEVRQSVDIDLLVAPDRFGDAERALEDLGYRHRLAGTAACEIATNARELLAASGVCIDLHRQLIGVPSPEEAWPVLSGRTVALTLASGVEVAVLDLEARAMHLALHAAQDGPQDRKASDDLARGLAQLPVDTWRAAADLAGRLGATAAFAAGLRLSRAGQALATELGLPDRVGVELSLRVQSAPHESLFFEQLAAAPGMSAKAKLVGRKLWPTEAYLRAAVPNVRDRRWGLAVARLGRLESLARRAPPALRAWLRARRKFGQAGHR